MILGYSSIPTKPPRPRITFCGVSNWSRDPSAELCRHKACRYVWRIRRNWIQWLWLRFRTQWKHPTPLISLRDFESVHWNAECWIVASLRGLLGGENASWQCDLDAIKGLSVAVPRCLLITKWLMRLWHGDMWILFRSGTTMWNVELIWENPNVLTTVPVDFGKKGRWRWFLSHSTKEPLTRGNRSPCRISNPKEDSRHAGLKGDRECPTVAVTRLRLAQIPIFSAHHRTEDCG